MILVILYIVVTPWRGPSHGFVSHALPDTVDYTSLRVHGLTDCTWIVPGSWEDK